MNEYILMTKNREGIYVYDKDVSVKSLKEEIKFKKLECLIMNPFAGFLSPKQIREYNSK